ncbi:hypothetical protein GCM10022409_29730 [Hymenobacter glaciei]|uniref:Uncharacterized protein n=1 Tax=Hymenobacter glaciei TaxID=877209 RepID=A0ABP7UER7_9BACT
MVEVVKPLGEGLHLGLYGGIIGHGGGTGSGTRVGNQTKYANYGGSLKLIGAQKKPPYRAAFAVVSVSVAKR